MNELHIARKIRQALDSRAKEINPAAVERLRLARDKALRVQRQPALEFSAAWVGANVGRLAEPAAVSRYWLPLAALVFGIAMIMQWQNAQPTLSVAEAEEIDSALLTSELPINAYLDRGFDAWLKRTSE
jgi:hypothetical protein